MDSQCCVLSVSVLRSLSLRVYFLIFCYVWLKLLLFLKTTVKSNWIGETGFEYLQHLNKCPAIRSELRQLGWDINFNIMHVILSHVKRLHFYFFIIIIYFLAT